MALSTANATPVTDPGALTPGQHTATVTLTGSNGQPVTTASVQEAALWQTIAPSPNVAPTAAESQFLQDQFDATNIRIAQGDPYALAGHHDSALAGFKFPANMSQNEFLAATTAAEQWAASVGWKYFPTGQEIMNLYNRGSGAYGQTVGAYAQSGAITPEIAAQYFSSFLSAADKAAMPWAQYGLTKLDYESKVQSVKDVLVELGGSNITGVGSDFYNWAIQGKMSAAAIRDHLMNTDNFFKSSHPWMQYNLNYSDYQQYKTTNKAKLQQRFGQQGATDASTLADLANPLVAYGATATAATQPQPTNTQTPLASTAGAQAVR